MAMYDSSRVEVGAGSLYWAPLGTVEPTAVTGAWGAGWSALGYTDAGSVFSFQPQTAALEVEEEIYPILNTVTSITATVAFALAEQTRDNLGLVLNGGAGASAVSGTTGTNADGSVWVEPPDPGTEIRLMLGWDALPKGGTVGVGFGRIICRKAFQTGQIQISRKKGNNKALYTATFSLEKPAGARPFRAIFPNVLSS